MRSRSAQRLGLSLVEVLVALGIVAILLSAIIALTTSLLGFSTRVNATNERLTDLSDAAGYVSTNARRSMGLVGDGSTSIEISADGATFTCSVASSDGACLALLVPVVDRDSPSSEITDFNLLAYRFTTLGDWAGDPGLAPGWNGQDTPILLEYEASACTSCSEPPSIPASMTATSTSLVIPDLVVENPPGTSIVPFEVTNGRTRVTVRLWSRGSNATDHVLVPADGPLVAQAVRRP